MLNIWWKVFSDFTPTIYPHLTWVWMVQYIGFQEERKRKVREMGFLINGLGKFVVYTVLALVTIGIILNTALGKGLLVIIGVFIAFAVVNMLISTMKNAKGLIGDTKEPQIFPYEPVSDNYMEENYRQVYGDYNPDVDFNTTVEPVSNPAPKPYIRAPKRPNL